VSRTSPGEITQSDVVVKEPNAPKKLLVPPVTKPDLGKGHPNKLAVTNDFIKMQLSSDPDNDPKQTTPLQRNVGGSCLVREHEKSLVPTTVSLGPSTISGLRDTPKTIVVPVKVSQTILKTIFSIVDDGVIDLVFFMNRLEPYLAASTEVGDEMVAKAAIPRKNWRVLEESMVKRIERLVDCFGIVSLAKHFF